VAATTCVPRIQSSSHQLDTALGVLRSPPLAAAAIGGPAGLPPKVPTPPNQQNRTHAKATYPGTSRSRGKVPTSRLLRARHSRSRSLAILNQASSAALPTIPEEKERLAVQPTLSLHPLRRSKTMDESPSLSGRGPASSTDQSDASGSDLGSGRKDSGDNSPLPQEASVKDDLSPTHSMRDRASSDDKRSPRTESCASMSVSGVPALVGASSPTRNSVHHRVSSQVLEGRQCILEMPEL
jgi:hypothetical protein